MRPREPIFSRRIGKFRGDRRAFALLLLAALFVAGRAWLAQHPEHNPWAPLDLRQSRFPSAEDGGNRDGEAGEENATRSAP